MKIMSNDNEILANFQFDSTMLRLECSQILNRYLCIYFACDSIPHNQLQKLYEYVAKQIGDTTWILKELEEKNVSLFVPYDASTGIVDLNKILCYAFSLYQNDIDTLKHFEEILENYKECNLKVELTPMEKFDLAKCFIAIKVDLSMLKEAIEKIIKII